MFNVKIIILALCMLVTGSINTITTKYQDITVTGTDAKGRELTFKHPAVQSAMMFFGELLCLVPFFISYWLSTAGSGAAGKRGFPSETRAHKLRTLLTFAMPAFCDAGATTMLNIGLFYTYASVFQMLRGTMVVFAGLFTIVILRRALHLHHWMGIILILAGATLVGASSVIYDGGAVKGSHGHRRSLHWSEGGMVGEDLGSSESAAKNPLLGDILVILAQVLAATQFIVEEKYLAKYRVPALLAVGLEGFWGLLISAIALPILGTVRGSDGLPLDSTTQAFREIAGSTQLQLTTVGSILSIAFFNFFGISVTKNLSGAARCTIDACRTLFVWMFSLYAGWEMFHSLEVVGFVVLVSGTSLYNELIRSCLPTMYESTVDNDMEDPLLAAAPEDRGLAVQPHQASANDGTRPGQRHNVHMIAKPRSISGSLYTMARSMRLFPTALSPHSLASPATHGLAGVRVHPSNSSMLSVTPDNSIGYIPGDELPNGVSLQEDEGEEGSSAGQVVEEVQPFKKRSAPH